MRRTLALIVACDVARRSRESGARQRLDSLAQIASNLCDEVRVIGPGEWRRTPARIDLVVGQSWSTTRSARRLQVHSRVVWFDACDSTVDLRTSVRGIRRVKSMVALARDVAYTRSFSPDVVTYITASDAASDAHLWSKQPLVLPIHWPKYSPLRFNGSRRIVFAGDGHYLPNREAVLWAVTVLVPTLRAAGVKYPLWVYGNGYDISDQDGVHFAGYEPSSNALYRQGDIHIAPVMTGAGMNSKVSIPLIAGLDVVTTPLGARGLIPSARTTVCELNDFAQAIAKLSSTPVSAPLELSLAQVLQQDDTETLLTRLHQKLYGDSDS